ncbi:hypothetical protein SAMN04515617_10535 [Collimonas sp. OK242]|jgi:hypothetical protein|nr:hypothetical protein [Collimonas sp. OK242]SDX59099.1 hypothetical protein SAMN04515617_10535 [Collimonas sp. OK242]
MKMIYAQEHRRRKHVTPVPGANDANAKLTLAHIQAAPRRVRKTK